ncbi:MAG: type III pantothenate kinase [bacterium]|nr:type III pantothenate kinase [bacterium]
MPHQSPPPTLLLLDIGNQFTKAAWAPSPKRLRPLPPIPTPTFPARLPDLLAHAPAPPRAIALASVVPDITSTIQNSLLSLPSPPPLLILNYTSFSRLMPSRVKPPLEPGPDRLANALALRTLYSLPACAIDLGSALTLEIVDRRGAFVSGAIAPGPNLQLAALHLGTAQLRAVTALLPSIPRRGTSTQAAITIGVRLGLIATARALIDHASSVLRHSPASIVLTGGDAHLLLPALRRSFPKLIHDPLLTLRGLAIFAAALSPNTLPDLHH